MCYKEKNGNHIYESRLYIIQHINKCAGLTREYDKKKKLVKQRFNIYMPTKFNRVFPS